MAREWFCEVMGQLFGPLEPAELRRMAKAGDLTPTDKVRQGENGKWVDAGKVKGLFEDRATGNHPNAGGEPLLPPMATPPAVRPAPAASQLRPPIAAPPAVPHAVPLQAGHCGTPTAVQINVSTSKAAHSLGIGSVILGSLALVTICIPFLGIPLSAIGL